METLATGYVLAEAPRWDGAGGLYFSDAAGGGVYRWLEGEVATVVPKRRGVGGLVLHERGGIVVTGRQVVHIDGDGTRVVLAVEGALGFNDLTTDARGRVLVGSIRFDALAGAAPVPGELWRVGPGDERAELYGGVDWANGVGLSPDGGVVYHCDYARRHILAHDLTDSGAVNRRVFAVSPDGSVDGLAVDEQGCVWAALGAGGGIARFLPDGTLDSVLDVPASFVTSLSFGGEDGRDMFITTADADARGSVLRTRVDVAGAPVAPASV